MHNAYITSTLYALRGKGSVSFCFNDYCNSPHLLSDRFERNPLHASSTQCCSCCGVGFSSHKLTTNRCYLYGPRQSSLLNWPASRKLVFGGGDRYYCCYYNCSPSYGLERACCVNERIVCCNGRRNRCKLRCCCVVGEDSWRVNDAEALLSLLSEGVEENEDEGYCVGGGKRRNLSSYRRFETKRKGELRDRERNLGWYERVEARKRASGDGFCECGRKKNGGIGLGDGDQNRGFGAARIELRRSEKEDAATLRGENRRLRRGGSSFSSYKSLSSSGDLDDESEIHDKHTLLAEETLTGYEDSKVKQRGRIDSQVVEKYEGYVDDIDENSGQRNTSVASDVEWDRKNKLEKKRNNLLVEEIQESGQDSSQRPSHERIPSLNEQFNDKKETSTSTVSLARHTRKQNARSENQVDEASTSRRKFVENAEIRESHRDDTKRMSQSQIRLGSTKENVEIAKDERHKAGSYKAKEENINRNNRINRISEVQDFDTQRTSISQTRSDIGVIGVGEYRKNVSSSQHGREQLYHETSQQANARRNSEQAIKISEINDTNDRKTSSTQSQTSVSNQVNNANLISISYQAATQPQQQPTSQANVRRNYEQATKISEIHDTNIAETSIMQSQTSVSNQVNNTNLISISCQEATQPQHHPQLQPQTDQRTPQRAQSEQGSCAMDDTMVVRPSESDRVFDSRRSSETRVHQEIEAIFVGTSVGEGRAGNNQTSEKLRQSMHRKELEEASMSQERLRLDYQARKDGVEEGVQRSTQTTVMPPRSQSLVRSSLRDELEGGFESQKIFDKTSGGTSFSPSSADSRKQTSSSQQDLYERSQRPETRGEPLYLMAPEDSLGSADRLQQSSAQFVGEFVEKARHKASSSEILRVDGFSETKTASEDDTNRQMESTQFGSEGFQPKEEQDKGHSSGGSGEKGPSDDMWDVIESSVFKTPKAEEMEPTPTAENAIAKRSGRSLWNIIADIITLKWGSPSETSNSASRSGRHISSNESAASEAWFSTHESEQSRDKPSSNRGHLQSDKKSDRLQVTGSSGRSMRDPEAKPSPSTTRMGSGSTSNRISFSADESLGWSEGGKSSRASPSGIEITESPSRRIVSQTSDTTSTTKSDLVEQVEPFGPAKESEISSGEGRGGGELKRRKLQRIQQVPKDRFDEWEEAFTLESEQRKLDEMFMREALIEAKKAADTWEVPVGAVLVHNGSIIARGYNLVEELRDSTAHAEMICIREASNHLRSWRLADTTLYVTLEPCPMCAGAILQARVSSLVWGAPNKLLGADGSWIRLFPDGSDGGNNSAASDKPAPPIHPFHPKMNIRRGLLATECAEVMQQFFQLRRKKKEKQASKEEREDGSRLLSTSHPTKFVKKMHDIFHRHVIILPLPREGGLRVTRPNSRLGMGGLDIRHTGLGNMGRTNVHTTLEPPLWVTGPRYLTRR